MFLYFLLEYQWSILSAIVFSTRNWCASFGDDQINLLHIYVFCLLLLFVLRFSYTCTGNYVYYGFLEILDVYLLAIFFAWIQLCIGSWVIWKRGYANPFFFCTSKYLSWTIQLFLK
ncbi:Uncharacterized protein TCM_008702 [Theobroma cacao]|uniref:Uncharacterized protein n=1 Tax=Theobroma cacao TaxID=3641 RepID=A0A061E586_THECC|nr:Uncharacterized protein TCM_008702 [Theobroma cacao]